MGQGMIAKSLEEVRSAFEDEKLAAAFGKKFIDAYAATAFGVLPKREMDLQVFSFLVENGVVDADGSMYRLARALNLTPSRAKTLLFEHQLRNVTEQDTDHAVMIALTTAKYWKEGDTLAFGITSPLVKAAIAGKMQDRGVFAETSLTGDILYLNPEHFGEVVDDLISSAQAERLVELLKKKKVLSEGQVRAALKAVATAGAKEVGSNVSKFGFDITLKALRALAQGDDVGLSAFGKILSIAINST